MVNKSIALLGATGSIGMSTFAVVEEQKIPVVLATAHKNYNSLLHSAYRYHIPSLFFTGIEDTALQAKLKSENPTINIYFGETELLKAIAEEDYDLALNAIAGSSGLRFSYAILKSKKTLALANKESLVMGGHILTKMLSKKPILPVDSELSALFQAIGKHRSGKIRFLHLTASGGIFRNLPLEDFTKITPQQALINPNWSMGAKVTLDSATMFNKALEVMEAHWLFKQPYSKINAVIHPQSIIHSLVEFIDGSFLAQMSKPDMKLPILYALSWKKRVKSQLVKTDLLSLPPLTFREIEPKRYPLFYLGLEAANAGGIYPTVINAAVEAASFLFLQNKIPYLQMTDLVKKALDEQEPISEPELETIMEINQQTYQKVLQ
ncbi:MAG: 1-deoxy-D-xylulose 5-phosphate reductoisomerase [Candidatus Cloacimonetes bacterium ADurb.Bin089]|nr:MAG: 1-deoxy-D-xylulose 5-phosphate reductoisomerase [Candidatus Cloacimonetes bacterium ADurb.Bin089]